MTGITVRSDSRNVHQRKGNVLVCAAHTQSNHPLTHDFIASINPRLHHGTLKPRPPTMGSSTHRRSAGAMPASQEAIQRVILPALKRTFGAYVKNRAVIQKLISGEFEVIDVLWVGTDLCGLIASFVVYALRSTYSNLSGNTRKSKKDEHPSSRSRA